MISSPTQWPDLEQRDSAFTGMPVLYLSERQQTQSSWSPDSKKTSEKVSRWMYKLYFGKCVYFYAQGWYWEK